MHIVAQGMGFYIVVATLSLYYNGEQTKTRFVTVKFLKNILYQMDNKK